MCAYSPCGRICTCVVPSSSTVPFPNGKSEVLLYVPRYDFNWQTRYVLSQPRFLPAGTHLECTGTWDNSKDNPNNPDPSRTVSWGQQTEDEMMIGFFEYVEDKAR